MLLLHTVVHVHVPLKEYLQNITIVPSCFLFLTLLLPYPVLALSFSPLIQSEDNTQFHTRSRRQQQQQNDPNYLVFSPDDDISSDEEDPDAGDENDDGGGGEKI